jgi:hypothetical protein
MFVRCLAIAIGNVTVGPLAEANEDLFNRATWIIPFQAHQRETIFAIIKHVIIEIFQVRGADHNPRVRRHEVSTFVFEQERVRRDLVADQVQAEIDAFKYQLDGDFDDDMLDDGENGFSLMRLKRDDPCRAIKQVFIGFRKWADRYIANCDGQATHKHMHKRALKFYNEFREVCEDIPRIDISA